MSHHSIQRLFVRICLLCLGGQAVFAATGGPDGYGYTWVDSNETNGPAFLFIEPTPAAVTVIGNTSTVAATVLLVHPWSGIYGQKVNELRVSRNGFISDLLSDPGTDEANAHALPKPPASGGGQRIYALHTALRLDPSSGRVAYEYFPESPHPLHACGVHVITWTDVFHAAGPTNRFRFQVLLFDNFDILLQYDGGNPQEGANSTTGIQDAALTHGLLVAANAPGSVPGTYAVRIRPPIVLVNTGEDQFDTPAGPERSLREAIRDAAPGSRIEFADAYTIVLSSSFAHRIPLNGLNLAIDGASVFGSPSLFGFSGAATVNGNHQLRHFRLFNETHLYLGHLRLIRGYGPATDLSGSTLVEEGSSLIAFATEWNENRTELDGGAVAVRHSNTVVRLHGGVLRMNQAEGQGGAVALRNGATLRMDHVRLIANRADTGGGGLFAQSGTLDVRATEFALNETVNNGGGVQLGPGLTGLFFGVTVDDNRALNGGGVSIDNTISAINSPSALTFQRCTFSDNIALLAGGAVYEDSENFFGDSANPDFFYCTIVRNGAGVRGGGVATVKGQPRFSGVCLALNTAGTSPNNFHTLGSGTAVTLGENLESGGDAGFTGLLDIQNTDPLLSALGYHGGPVRTCMPLAGSPLIDAAPLLSYWPGRDARGVGAPPFDGNGDGSFFADIGAVEVGPTVWVTTGSAAALQNAIDTAPRGGVIGFSNVSHIVDADLSIPTNAMIFVQKEGQSLRLEDANVRLTNGPNQHVSFYNVDFIANSNGALAVTDGSSLGLEQVQVRKVAYSYASGGPSRSAVHNASGQLSLNGVRVVEGSMYYGLYQQGPNAHGWIRDTLLQRNEADFWLIRAENSDLILQRSSVVDNAGPGSVYLGQGYSVLENNTVAGNRRPLSVGHSAVEYLPLSGVGGGLLMRNNTVVENDQVYGVRFWSSGILWAERLEFANNIVAFNASVPHSLANTISSGGNLSDTGIPGALPSDQPFTDPKLFPLSLGRNGTLHHAPRPGSPAIDAGVSLFAGLRDGRGGFRYRNGDGLGGPEQDIGAVESGRILSVTTPLDENDGALGLGAGDSLRECMQAATNFGGAVNINLSLIGESALTAQFVVSDAVVDIDGLSTTPHLQLGTGGKLFRTTGNAQVAVAGIRTGSSGGALLTEDASVATWHGGSITGATSVAVDANQSSRARISGTSIHGNTGSRSAWIRGNGQAEFVDTTFSGNTNSLYVVQAQNTAEVSLHRVTLTKNVSGTRDLILSNAARGSLHQSTFWRHGHAISVPGADALLLVRQSIFGNLASPGGSGFVGSSAIRSFGQNISDRSPSFFDGSPFFLGGKGDLTYRNAYLGPLFDHDGNGVATYRPIAISRVHRARIGAHRPPPPWQSHFKVVTTTADKEEASPASSNLSLREAIRDVESGGVVLFDRSLNDATFELTLNGGVIGIPNKHVVIDATELPRGIQIVGRLLSTGAGKTLGLHAIHFRDYDAGPVVGGAVAIPSGNLVGSHLAFSGLNSAAGGGAIALQNGRMALENVTFSGNTAAALGSAIYLFNATSRVEFATFADQGGSAAGVVQGANSTVHLYGSVFFRNAQAAFSGLTLVSEGYNAFPGNPAGSVPADSVNHSALADAYEPFGHYGGWVPTYRPLPLATNVIDTLPPIVEGSVPPPLSDARGFARIAGASADWGAHEFGGGTFDSDGDGLPDWWELQVGLDPNGFTDPAQDLDGDGYSLADELGWGTNPFDSNSNPGIVFTMSPSHAPTAEATWNTLAGETYLLEATRSLVNLPWLPVASLVGDGLPAALDHVSAIAETDQEFYRLRRAGALPTPRWVVQVVDDSDDVGSSLSLAYGPDGHPAIAYSHDAWTRVMFATRNPQSDWTIESVYLHPGFSPSVLSPRSLAFSPAGVPAIISGQVNVNQISNHLFAGTNWLNTITFMSGQGAGSNGIPRVFQANGEPAIAYRNEASGFVHYVTNNLFPSQVSVVDNSPGNGGTVSLAASPAGRVGLCYANTLQNELRYAERVGGVWQIVGVVPVASLHHAIEFAPNGEPAIAYRRADQRLGYAYFDGATWQTETADAVHTIAGPISLAFSPLGKPIIAYTTGPGVLRVAQREGGIWSSTSVAFPAAFPSLAIGPSGRPAVAFQDPIEQNVYFAEEVVPERD